MLKLQNLLALFLLTSLPSFAAEQWWKVNGKPVIGKFRGGLLPEDTLDELKTFLQTDKFEEWETYEDDLVKIQYPKHPLLKLEVKKNNAGIRVEGGVCTSVDNSFQTAYYLTAGEATYGVFLVQAANWLDDGICMCGPMVHHVYNIEDGCLVRFSLLPGGAVKKAQMIGDKLRLMSFEWTHLACPKDIYEEMVERMQLKVKSKHSPEELKKQLAEQYGFDGTAGLLQSGMKVSDAIKFMGKPAADSDTQVIWHGISGDYRSKVTVAVKDGVISKIEDTTTRSLTGEPMLGTLSWATNQISDKNGNLEAGHNIDLKTKKEILEIALKIAESDRDRSWRAIRIIKKLAESYEYTDQQVVTSLMSNKLDSEIFTYRLLNTYLKAGKLDKAQKLTWISNTLESMKDQDVYSLKGNGFSFDPPYESAQSYFAQLINDAFELDKAKAKAILDEVLIKKNPSWITPLLEELKAHLSDQQQSTLIVEALTKGMELQNGHIVTVGMEKVLETKPNAATKDKLLTIINKLPKGQEDSDWRKSLEAAIKHLSN